MRVSSMKVDWKTNEALAAGKGATVQEFFATAGKDKLKIGVFPWGEGHLTINGREIAHIDHAKDRRGAFRELQNMALLYGPAARCKPKVMIWR
jgi:enoyl-[acyl-carrier protein] reductase I